MAIASERRQFRALIIPSIAGNLLEYYDFAIYGYLAPIIGHLFFPLGNKFLSLLAAFGVFAAGFFMRPVGAAVFGYIGDKWGRKKALATTIMLMGCTTTLIGLLPTYTHAGIYAGIALTLCRLLQGLAIGGEFGGSIVYLVEHAPVHQRGLFGSWVMFSTYGGLLLGSVVSAIILNFVTADWAWRIPFLASLLLSFVGYYLRLRLPETPEFNKIFANKTTVRNPVLNIIREQPLKLLKTTGLDFLPAISFYVLFIYLTSYLNVYLKVPLNIALIINSLSLLLVVILIPYLGHLSDKIGRKKIMLIGASLFCLLSYPLFLLLAKADFLSILLAQSMFGIAIAFCCAAMPATFTEMFATQYRYTGVALSYNLANAIFGGTAPLVVTLVLHKSHNLFAPSFYLILAGLIMLISVFSIKETYRTVF